VLFDFPELQSMLDLLATRTRVAHEEGVLAWRPRRHASTPSFLCSRAQPCEFNRRNGYTKKPCEKAALG